MAEQIEIKYNFKIFLNVKEIKKLQNRKYMGKYKKYILYLILFKE